ncbi:MAG: hypothetical protein LBC79_06375, partial [Deltaproteobacteria bacterium]|nr:hypothetical protein [Deltaproteobacteria bacterium]
MMKKLAVFALALTMTLGAVAPAFAVDIKAGGTMEFGFYIHDGLSSTTDGQGLKEGQDNDFQARQRIRPWVSFIASESLSALLRFEIGDGRWGNAGAPGGPPAGMTSATGGGFGMSTRGVNLELWHAYLDWIVPNSSLKIRMGLQGLTMPTSFGRNPIFDEHFAGITASNKFSDTAAVTLFWVRPFDGAGNLYGKGGSADFYTDVNGNKQVGASKFDIFGLTL